MENQEINTILKFETKENYLSLDDIITYNISLRFEGEGVISNIVIRNTPPVELDFIYGSVTIDNICEKNMMPQNGICILFAELNHTYNISYKFKLTKTPVKGIIENNATINYDYFKPINEVPKTIEIITNTVKTIINTVDFCGDNIQKKLSTNYIEFGDELEYIYTIKNNGNIVASNVVLKESIPLELKFIEGTVEINDIYFKYINPIDGISLGSIKQGETHIVKFKVSAVILNKKHEVESTGKLIYGELSNPFLEPKIQVINTETKKIFIDYPMIELVKTIDKTEAIVGESLNINVNIINTGNVAIENIKFYEERLNFLKLKEDSLKINGKPYSKGTLASWIAIDSLQVGEVLSLSYEAIVSNPLNGKNVISRSRATYSYTLHNKNLINEIYSNDISLWLEKSNIVIEFLDKNEEFNIGEEICKTIKITNEGTLIALNTFLFVNNPDELSNLINCVIINDIPRPDLFLGEGIPLYDIMPSEEVLISYRVKVIDCNDKNIITSKAFTKYEYKINYNSLIKDRISTVTENKTYLKSPLFKQLNVDGVINIGNRYEVVSEVDDVKCEIVISNYRIVPTNGFNMASLAITGYIIERIQYTVLESSKTLNITSKDKIFSTYIPLKDSTITRDRITIDTSNIEITCRKITNNSLYSNISFNISGKVR